jgi:O-antigen/teichoic acid export membrane protein
MQKSLSLKFFKDIWGKTKTDTFFVSTAMLFVGSLFVGFINYCYQFVMARMLSVPDYGELQSLLSLLSIITVFSSALSLVVVKYTTEFVAEKNLNKVYSLFLLFSKKIFWMSILFYVIFAIFSSLFSKFLNLHSVTSLLIIGLAFVFGFLGTVSLSLLRGMQKFKEFSLLSLIQAVLKLFFSLLLVKLGFSINGAVGAVVLAAFFAYLFSFYPIRFLFKQKKEFVQGKKILAYSLPVFFTLLSTTLLWSTDIIMVKHFFSAQIAGEYAAISMLGKIIFFVIGPVASVMFPLAAGAHAAFGFPAKILKKALFLTSFIGGAMILVYWLFPELVIRLLVGEKFLAMSPYLAYYAFAMFVYSLVSLLANYFLSIGKIKATYFVIFGAFVQVFGILIFHQSISQILWVLVASLFFTFLSLIWYFRQIYYRKV